MKYGAACLLLVAALGGCGTRAQAIRECQSENPRPFVEIIGPLFGPLGGVISASTDAAKEREEKVSACYSKKLNELQMQEIIEKAGAYPPPAMEARPIPTNTYDSN
jgi:hypothetical protein